MERQPPPPPAARSAARSSAIRRPASRPLDRQLALIGVLLTLAAVAWVITARRMAGMDAGPWTDPGALGFYISTWVVMMAAMMLPSLAPVMLRYSDHQQLRYSDHQHGPGPHVRISRAGKTGLFVGGYLAVWAAAGLVGYALLEAGRSLDGGVFSWDRAGRWTAAGVLLVATLYQFTPAKRACLTRCRNARASRYGTSRDHRAPRDGGLRAGIQHGAWCLGCCWALMVALFALGAMSVAWMVLISVLIAGERLLPWRTLGAIGVAAVLAALTIGVAAAPSRVPLLRIPHASMSMRAMGSK